MANHRAGTWIVTLATVILVLVASAILLRYQKDVYRVGLLYPATGENARLGESVRRASELAQDNANRTLFMGSTRKLKLDYRDTEGRPSIARSQFLALVDLDHVPLVVGSVLSSDTQGFMKDAETRKVVVLANGSSDPRLRTIIGGQGNFIFRNWPSDDAEGLQMGEYAKKSLSLNNGYAFIADDPYARSLAMAFQQSFTHAGGIVRMEIYPEDLTDFTILVKKAAETNPQFVYLVGFPGDLGHLVAEIRAQMGEEIPILSAVGIESAEFFQIAGAYANNIFYTAPYVNPGSPEYLDFQEAYKKRFKENPDITAAITYDAVMISAKIISEVGYSSDKIKTALYRVADYPGVSGFTSFTAVGDVVKPVSIKRIEHGRAYLLEVFHDEGAHK